MWKAVSRSISEVVERRVGFTAFRCDASKTNPQDPNERCSTSTSQPSCAVQRWTQCCLLKHVKSAYVKSRSGSEDGQHQENKHHEDKWDEPHIIRPWLGAMGWSTALVLGWYICQPFGWCHILKDSHRRCLLRRKERELSCTTPALVFSHQPLPTLRILPVNSTHEIIDGRPISSSSTFESGDTGVGHDCSEEVFVNTNRTPSLSSSTDTGVSIDDSDELFAQHRGPFTPEEALNEASRVFAAASRTFTGDVENKLGMFYMDRKQHSEALRHFRRASHHDNANGAYNIGQCYELGLGTAQNLRKAAKWYKIASDRGHSVAMYNLAIFFARGMGGLSEDKERAYELLRAASSLGLKEAEDALSLVNDKPEDVRVQPTTEYSDMAVGSHQFQFDFSHLDCVDLSFTSQRDDEQPKDTEKSHFYDDLDLKSRWGLNRICFKLPIDHDATVV